MEKPIIRANDLHKRFGSTDVLCGVDLDILPNEIVTIVGRSGSGKSTLLNIIGTLLTPDRGTVEIQGRQIVGLGNRDLSAIRSSVVGFVFQFHHLIDEFSALENVALPGYIARRESRRVIEARAMDLLQRMGMGDKIEQRPSTMSGGEKQRVAIARALINRPLVILADEPTGNLDSVNAAQITKLFESLVQQSNADISTEGGANSTLGGDGGIGIGSGKDMANYTPSFVIVTHDKDLAAIGHRRLTLTDGIFQP